MTSPIQKLVVLAVVLSIAGCKCETQVSKRNPKIEVLDDMGNTRTSVDFGKVQLQFSATKTVRIRNSGTSALTLSKADFSQALFGLGEPMPVSIEVNGEYLLPLTFTPTVADQRESATVTVTSDDPLTPTVQLSLAGTGVTATAVLQPTTLDFGEVYVGEQKDLTFSLTNSGSNELPVTDARFTSALDPTVTAPLSTLVKTLGGGETATVTVHFAPTSIVSLMGDLELVMPNGVGTKTVPVRGAGIQAQPKLCFKFDDATTEQCTDGTVGMNLDVRFGSFCDARVYPADGGLQCEFDGGAVPYERSGAFFVRNDGNTPVSYTLQIVAGQPSRCDGGASIDFTYANAPTTADGGAQAQWMVPSFKLPTAVTDPRDWKTTPVAVRYRARSACRGDDTDLSTILWTRQGEPLGTARRPNTMLATLTGNSLLAEPLPFPVTYTGNSPMPQDVALVSNAGGGPVRLLSAALWQSSDGGLTPDVPCASVDAGPCTSYAWIDGPTLPVLLEGSNVAGTRISKKVGRLAYGSYNPDGGLYTAPSQEQRVWAVVTTSDPYVPTVTVPIIGRFQ